MKKSKVKVFIDGSNIYFAQKKMGEWLDWVKVKRYLDEKYDVVEIRYYAGIRKKDPKMNDFLKKLQKIGFKTVTKPVKHLLDEQGHYLEKANFDVEITGDVLKSLSLVDTVILFSGDSDFVYLVKLIHEDSKKIYVYSSRQTLAWELKLKSDHFFLLENLSFLTKVKKFVKL